MEVDNIGSIWRHTQAAIMLKLPFARIRKLNRSLLVPTHIIIQEFRDPYWPIKFSFDHFKEDMVVHNRDIFWRRVERYNSSLAHRIRVNENIGVVATKPVARPIHHTEDVPLVRGEENPGGGFRHLPQFLLRQIEFVNRS